MAIARITASAGAGGFTNGAAGHAVTFPGSYAAASGDIIYMIVSGDDVLSSFSSPWTQLKADVNHLGAYLLRLKGSAAVGATTVTLTTGSNAPTAWGMVAYTGVDNTTPEDGAINAANNIVAAALTPSVSTPTRNGAAGQVVLGCAFLGDLRNGAPTSLLWTPSGMNNIVDGGSGSSLVTDQWVDIGEYFAPSPTAAIATSLAWSANMGLQTGMAVVLNPAAGGGPVNHGAGFLPFF
jgi:hypothetical protein